MKSKMTVLCFLMVLLSFALANADQGLSEQHPYDENPIWNRFEVGDQTDSKCILNRLLPVKAGPFDIGGFFRYNYTYKSWDEFYEDHGQFDFDTFALHIDLDGTDNIIGSFQYRWYRGRGGSDYHFLRHAWLGYEFDNEDQLQFGINQVPFGILPYASHNWFFQLPYYIGLEADFDLGVKYIKNDGNWNQQFAYYAMDEGQYYGDSLDSSKYAYDVVKTDAFDTMNTERNQINYRLAYTDHQDQDNTTEYGFSAQWSQIHNSMTNDNGSHYALGVHMNGDYGPYNVMLQAMRYEYSLENPDGADNSFVAMGAYDAPYKVAKRGYLLTAGVSKDIEVDFGPVDEITVYNDYGVLFKDDSDFKTSQQNVLGFSFTVGRVTTFVDLALGQNHAWVGPGWTDSFAAGDGDAWHTRFNVNVGYYF